MSKRLVLAPMGAILTSVLLAALIAACAPQGKADVDTDALAEKLVAQCANISEGDLVRVSGSVRDAKLLEDIALRVRKLGAFPLVTLASERYAHRYYDEVPEKYDSQPRALGMALADIFTAQIFVDVGVTPGLLADVPPERFAAQGKVDAPVNERLRERNVRFVNLGNDLYPTPALAKQYGLSREKLSSIFWDGVDTDYSELQAAGERVKAVLSAGTELQITAPNGTDLTLTITGRPALVSDGVISDEEMEQGGAACQVWLPAGEVYLVPVPGSAQGTVVVDRHFYQGEEIINMTLTFEAGALISMSAESGLEPLQARYDAAGAGKNLFGVMDIGLNPNVRIPTGSSMVAWMPAGMVTIGVGNNTWAGGDNSTDFSVYPHLPGCTVTVDGQTIVEEGKLAL
ncbi:MAG: aminopeptidase [Fidelibacterota bacterium]|nr:MAG: aminopeptidase [Candidatus Neomarinimicrobiota bacterium]